MSTSIFLAVFNVDFNIFTAVVRFGGPSILHILLSPQLSPLHPGVITLPSKLKMNCPPSSVAFFCTRSKLCLTKPTLISEGKPIFNFLRVGIDGIGKLNSHLTGLYLPLTVSLDATWEK